ncbi:MAG: PKD domain-containing protein [bacterium]
MKRLVTLFFIGTVVFALALLVLATATSASDDPVQIRFIVGHADGNLGGDSAAFEFFIGSTSCGVYPSTNPFECNTTPLLVTINDPGLLDLLESSTSISMQVDDPWYGLALSYARVEIDRSRSGTQSICLVDFGFQEDGSCADRDFCDGFSWPGTSTYTAEVVPTEDIPTDPVDPVISNQPPVAEIKAIDDARIPLPITVKVTPRVLNLSRSGRWVKAHLCPVPGTSQELNITLDGSGSYDPDGDPITCDWTLIGPEGEIPVQDTMITSVFLPAGTYRVSLVVKDGQEDSVSATTATETFELTNMTLEDLLAGQYTLNGVQDSGVKRGHDDDCVVAFFDYEAIAATVEADESDRSGRRKTPFRPSAPAEARLDQMMVLDGSATGVDYIYVIEGKGKRKALQIGLGSQRGR